MVIRTGKWLATCAVIAATVGCVTQPGFVRTTEPNWATVEIRDDLKYDDAWSTIVDTLVKNFDTEVMSKQDGYLRTGWMYTWTGKVTENYRVRVTIKFSPDQHRVAVKSEAEFGGPGQWVSGYDARLLETLKTDIMGTVGRTTR